MLLLPPLLEFFFHKIIFQPELADSFTYFFFQIQSAILVRNEKSSIFKSQSQIVWPDLEKTNTNDT